MRASLLLLCVCAVAQAQEEPAPEETPKEVVVAKPPPRSGTSISYSHKHQVGVHLQGSYGYRVLFVYDQNDFCGQTNRSACTGDTPPYFELGLSFAPSRSIELLCDLRVGLADDFSPMGTDSPRPFALAPGIKVYIDDVGSLKFFSTLQVMLDFTDYSSSGAATAVDAGVRNVNGLLVDMHRTFGLYLFVGDTTTIVRWLRFELDMGIGMQARFP